MVSNTDALQLLVTSRRMLHIRAEHVFPLDPLEVPAAEDSITAAVELFVEQARRFRPNYQPDDEDMAAIAELTRRLDGLPLAIELASARVRLMSPTSVLDRMGYERLDFLGSDPATCRLGSGRCATPSPGAIRCCRLNRNCSSPDWLYLLAAPTCRPSSR